MLDLGLSTAIDGIDETKNKTSSNFRTIGLPKGVSIDLPINWQVISNNQRITLDAYIETLFEPLDSDLPFAANYYNDNSVVEALVNIRYYPWIEVTQRDVLNATSEEVQYLDSELYKGILLSMKQIDGKIFPPGMGTNKKTAEQSAAQNTLEILKF